MGCAWPLLGLRALRALQVECRRVDAVAHTAGVAGAVREDMAEMRTAPAAQDLRSTHEQAVVGLFVDAAAVNRPREAGPAGTRVELVSGAEQLRAARPATIDAVVLGIDVLACERRLRALAPQHLVLHRRELLAPLLIALGHLLLHRIPPKQRRPSQLSSHRTFRHDKWTVDSSVLNVIESD